MKSIPLISVIVATRNEEANIEQCLKSIRGQNFSAMELIVVDNNSQDQTRSIARKYADLVFDIQKERNLSDIRNFRGAQLNFGVSLAKGSMIFFPDADMTFSPNLFIEAGTLLEHNDALYVSEAVEGDGLFQRIRNFERSFYDQTPIDAVRFVKKEIYQQVRGFDETNIEFGFDDWDFTKKLKEISAKFSICQIPIHHHEEKMSLITFLRKKKNYSSDYASYLSKWGKNDPDIQRQFGILYRLVGVFVEHGKWKYFFSKPHYVLGVLVLRAIVGALFMLQRSNAIFSSMKLKVI